VIAVPSCQPHLPVQLLLSTAKSDSAQMRPVTRDFLFEPLQLAGFIFSDPDARVHLSLPDGEPQAAGDSLWAETSLVSPAPAGKRSLPVVERSSSPGVQHGKPQTLCFFI